MSASALAGDPANPITLILVAVCAATMPPGSVVLHVQSGYLETET